jgi:hypothetical protein
MSLVLGLMPLYQPAIPIRSPGRDLLQLQLTQVGVKVHASATAGTSLRAI